MSDTNAAAFRRLHQNATPLRLPNAWDAASAGLFQHIGAPAIATTSAGVAWSLGYRDGRSLPVAEAVAAAARIVRVLKVPLTVDVENGYSDDPGVVAEIVQRLADIGVAGINIEDGADEPQRLAAKIEAIRSSLARARADLFVNARTDVFLAGLAEPAQRVGETIKRARLYAEAGADGLFVPALHEPPAITALVAGTALPLNVMAWPGLAGAEELGRLGVRRLSAGSAISQLAWGAAERAAAAFLETGESNPLFGGSKGFADLQRLFPDA